MWTDALLITASAVLAIQMGLVDAVGKAVGLRFRILSCPKCAVLWTSLGWHLLVAGRPLLPSVGASFLSSYLALWLVLLYDRMAALYNKAYERIDQEAPGDGGGTGEGEGGGPAQGRRAPSGLPSPGLREPQPGADAVPEVREIGTQKEQNT